MEVEYQDEAFFRSGFIDLGVAPEKIDDLARHYRETKKHVEMIYSQRAPAGFQGRDGLGTWFAMKRDRVKAAWNAAFQEIFRNREFLIEDSCKRTIEVPLFRLNSAPVKGSRAVYEEIITSQAELSWRITVLGTGMGATQGVEVSYATKLQSQNGDPKLLFIPVRVVVYLIGVYERGTCIGKGLRTEMEEIKNDRLLPGLRSDPDSADLPAVPQSELYTETFPLSGDASRNIQTYRQGFKNGTEFEIGSGIEAFALAAKSNIKISQKRDLSLTYDLPSGHDYEAIRANGQSGVWWRIR